MTEREYVIRYLARDAERYPDVSIADIADYLAERHGEGRHGGSGWLPHVPRDPELFYDPATGRVRHEWLQPEHTYHFGCTKHGVWLGRMSHMNKGKPDILWPEVAAYARRESQPRQLSLFGVAA